MDKIRIDTSAANSITKDYLLHLLEDVTGYIEELKDDADLPNHLKIDLLQSIEDRGSIVKVLNLFGVDIE